VNAKDFITNHRTNNKLCSHQGFGKVDVYLESSDRDSTKHSVRVNWCACGDVSYRKAIEFLAELEAATDFAEEVINELGVDNV
jgi:hypothetical protein